MSSGAATEIFNDCFKASDNENIFFSYATSILVTGAPTISTLTEVKFASFFIMAKASIICNKSFDGVILPTDNKQICPTGGLYNCFANCSTGIPWPTTSTFLLGKRKLSFEAVKILYANFSASHKRQLTALCVYQNKIFFFQILQKKPPKIQYSGFICTKT